MNRLKDLFEEFNWVRVTCIIEDLINIDVSNKIGKPLLSLERQSRIKQIKLNEGTHEIPKAIFTFKVSPV